MDKFCYLGDMLSVYGDADAAVEARVRIGWNKFNSYGLWDCLCVLQILHIDAIVRHMC